MRWMGGGQAEGGREKSGKQNQDPICRYVSDMLPRQEGAVHHHFSLLRLAVPLKSEFKGEKPLLPIVAASETYAGYSAGISSCLFQSKSGLCC